MLSGQAGSDRGFGGDGNDQLLGGTAVDQLFGESGNDSHDGGPALFDRCIDGSGVNSFVNCEFTLF